MNALRSRTLRRLGATAAAVVAGMALAAPSPLDALSAPKRAAKPPVESWQAPQARTNPDVPTNQVPERLSMEKGQRIELSKVTPYKARDPQAPRPFVIQGGEQDLGGGRERLRLFRTDPASPVSAEPSHAGRDTGDLVKNFTSVTSADAWNPPDHHLAVGPQYAVQVGNSGFAIFTKLGDQYNQYYDFESFLAESGKLPSVWSSQGFVFDPRIVYDPLEDKYVMMMMGKDEPNQKSYFWVAVSDNADPRGGWCVRRINATLTIDGEPAWLDFASLGTDAFGVYVTGNHIFYNGDGVHGAALHALPIETITGCDAITLWRFTNIQWPSGGDADSLQPAQAHTVNSNGETFFVNTQKFSGDKVMLTRLSGDRVNAPALTRTEIDIPAYNAIQNNVDQPGSLTDLDGGKSKAISAVYVNRRVFFSLTTDVLNDGSASGWLTVKLNTNDNTKEWHHLLWSGEGRYLFYPALTFNGTDPDSNIAVFGSFTDAETVDTADRDFASGVFKLYENHLFDSSGRYTLPVLGSAAYVDEDSNNRNRWGDYSGAAYDWTCGHAWGVVQSATGLQSFDTNIVGYEFDNEGPCPMIYVTEPSLDQVWESGSTVTIRWDAANLPADDEIIVVVVGDGVLAQIGGPLPAGTRSLQWEVHEYPGDENQIIVGSWDGSAYTALHNSDNFIIADGTAPSPNPVSWAAPPAADSPTDIVMAIDAVSDPSAPVEYEFDLFISPTGGAGGSDSGWQSATDFTDDALEANHNYCYRSRARDGAGNETAYSNLACAHTLARRPTAEAFSDITGLSATVNWGDNGNASFTEYQLHNVTLAVATEWINATSWNADGLSPGETYQFRVRARNGDGIVTAWRALGTVTTPASDPDGDGVLAAADNCLNVANPQQIDADGDGYGNRCDTDASQDCVTNVVDLGLLRSAFFTADPVLDFNGDGVVNAQDLGRMKQSFFQAPGPSGVTTVCN